MRFNRHRIVFGKMAALEGRTSFKRAGVGVAGADVRLFTREGDDPR